MKVLCIEQPKALPTRHAFEWLWVPKPMQNYRVFQTIKNGEKRYYQLFEAPVGFLFETKFFIPLTD